MQVAKAVSPPRLTGRPFRETKSGSETDEIPKHKRPIAFIVDTIPCEILDGEEHPSIVFKSKANSKDAKKVLLRRPINVEYKRRDSSTLKAIVPWAQLKSRLETDFGIMRSKPKKVETEGDAGSEEPEEVAEKEQPATGVPESTRAAAFQSSAISITLPYGFQAVKTLAHPKATLKSALYQPSFSTFTVLDHQSVHIWKGSMRINHIPISDGKGIKCSTTVKKDKKSLAGRALSGITHWTFIDKYQIYIIANSHLQLKVLDSQMIEMSTTLTSKPVLCFEFVPSKRELITGEVGSIKIWTLRKENVNRNYVFSLKLKREINEFEDGEWLNCVKYDRTFDRIFAGCDAHMMSFEYETGALVETLRSIHDLSISCIQYYEPSDTVITGGKDGAIKVWSRNYLSYNFHEHFSAITGLVLMEEGCQAPAGTMPLLLSCSLDGTIRLWNFETGQCLYRLDVNAECLGMQFLQKDVIYYTTPSSVNILNVNRYQVPFSFFKSAPTTLQRYRNCDGAPARLVTACRDGSIKILSPVTGIVISTLFPVHKDTYPKDILYDIENDLVYCICSNGEIAVYHSNTSPGRIIRVWDPDVKITSSCVVTFTLEKSNTPYLSIVAGTTDGQLVLLDTAQNGRRDNLVQAHTGTVEFLFHDKERRFIISCGSDLVIKVWSVFFQKTDTNGFAEDSSSVQIKLGYHSSISLTHMTSVSSVAAFCQPSGKIAIPYQGTITVKSYLEPSPHAQVAAISKEKMRKITHLARLAPFSLWATASIDKFVRIREDDGTLVREIQFNEEISCICFANERGDLLVGQSEQITLVRMQDYLPIKYIRLALEKDFEDDGQENAIPFDTSVDFWEYHAAEAAVAGDSHKWHFKTTQQESIERKLEFVDNDNTIERLLKISSERKYIATRKKLRKQFLQQEMNAFFKAEKLSLMHDGQQIDWKNGDSFASKKALENSVELIRPDSPTEFQTENPAELVLPPISLSEEAQDTLSGTQEIATYSSEEDDIIIERDVRDKAANISTRQGLSARRGTVLPNSSFLANEVSGIYRISSGRRLSSDDAPHRTSMMRKGSFLFPTSPESSVTKELYSDFDGELVPVRHYDIHRRESNANSLSAFQAKFKNLDDPNTSTLLEQDEEEMHSSSLDQVNGKTQDQISPSNGDTQSKSRTKKSSRKSKRKSVVLSSLKQENGVKQENSLLQREPSVREATPNKESSRQTPKSVENEMCPSLNGSELNIHSLFTIDVEMHLTQPIIADKTTTEREYRLPPLYTLGHEDTNSLLEKSSNVSNVSQPDPEDQKELKEFFTMPKQSRLKKQSILVGFQNVEQVTSGLTAAAPEASIYDGTEFVLEHAVGEHTAENEEEEDMIDTEVASRSQEIAGRCSWLAIKELSSQRRPTNKYRVARSLRASAVPEECGQTHGPTVLELLEMLSWNLRNGPAADKCEASKKIVFLYRTFRADFKEHDVFELFIRPHLDTSRDASWKVRTQISYNLGAFEFDHSEIRFTLIRGLADKDPAVKAGAMASLRQYGIDTIDKLREEMIRLGLLSDNLLGKGAMLQKMVLDAKRKSQIRKTNAQAGVRNWLKTADISRGHLTEEDAFVQHLVTPGLKAQLEPKWDNPPDISQRLTPTDELNGWRDVSDNPLLPRNNSKEKKGRTLPRPKHVLEPLPLKVRRDHQLVRWGARCLLTGATHPSVPALVRRLNR